MTISAEQWEALQQFRSGIEVEFQKHVINKPERLPAYDETIGVLRDSLDRYQVDLSNPEQVYYLVAGILSSLSFTSHYIATVCPDPHIMAHLAETSTFMGYLVRDLCYGVDAPAVVA